MNRCWVLLVTRGLRVWLPPEVYLQRDLALREAARWSRTLRVSVHPPTFAPSVRALHVIETLFPEPWRACTVRVGVTWTARSYPKMKVELMAADEAEGAAWLRRRVPRSVDLENREQVEFDRKGVPSSAGIFRVKRVMGF